MKINWDIIDTVLLDMDGTLIDRNVEDNFWDDFVPNLYAKKSGLPLSKAKSILFTKYKAKEGTSDWGNIDLWEKDLGLDLWAARKQAFSSVQLHPHTVRFLEFLKKQQKKIYLVTACNVRDTKIKLDATKMKGYWDGIYTQPEIGHSKSSVDFWTILQRRIGFDKNRTAFADDNQAALMGAKAFGIKWLIFKTIHNSTRPPHTTNKYLFCVRHFDDIL